MSDNTPAQQKSSKRGRALDERFYDLTDEERAFFKQQAGIQDDDELKSHVLQVQAEAYKVCRLVPSTKRRLMMTLVQRRFILTHASDASIS